MIINIIKRYIYLIPFGLSFYILDFFLRYYNLDINFGSMIALVPSFFTLAWVSFFAAVTLLFKKRNKKIVSIIMFLFFVLMLLVNYIYYNIFNTFFSFKSLVLAGEGLNYFGTVFSYIKLPMILFLTTSIVLFIISIKLMTKESIKSDKLFALFLILVASISYVSGRHFLGPKAAALEWDSWNYKRNIYDDYTETRKSVQVSGLYEYTIRDFYFSFFKKETLDPETVNEIDNYFSNSHGKDSAQLLSNFDNSYFDDKNIVIVMMESIESWLIDENVMPTLYKVKEESIDFTNHYSPIYGGGTTFNTEFTINTGYMTPFNGGSAAHSYLTNIFPYSLPNLFRNKGYTSIKQFHMNYSSFYNRGQMSKVFGYEKYYGSLDMNYPLKEVIDDSHFMKNKELKDLMLPTNEKFMSFVITYSAHMPYSLSNLECQVAITDEADRKKAMDDEEFNCAKAQAFNTDKFFSLLLKELDNRNIIDDTIIVAITDHYAYSFNDQERLHDLNGTNDNNLISRVPFFIWGKGIEGMKINSVNSNLDVLPTLAYLFNLDYNPRYYLGQNILSNNYNGFVFFADYSWYDGSVYYKNNEVVIGDESNVEKEYINSRNKDINTILDLNKKVLNSNYFKNTKTNNR